MIRFKLSSRDHSKRQRLSAKAVNTKSSEHSTYTVKKVKRVLG